MNEISPCARLLLLSALVMMAAGCTAPPKKSVLGAASAPLDDLNLLNTEVPEVLLDALRQPYALPEDRRCAALQARIKALDEVLGPDLDAKPDDKESTAAEKGAEQVETSLIDAIRRTTEGLVPFRSWVRKISGAEQYQKYLAATVAAGNARRAFLKGLRSARHCHH